MDHHQQAWFQRLLEAQDDSVCFDSDGCFICNKQKTAVAERFMRDHVLGILLNLDSESPNCHTISLFKDGRRVSKPQKLPEQLIGHALFPHVAFRNVTVQVLRHELACFRGPLGELWARALDALAFQVPKHAGPEVTHSFFVFCEEAAKADALVIPEASQDGNYEILLPIGLPDEGQEARDES